MEIAMPAVKSLQPLTTIQAEPHTMGYEVCVDYRLKNQIHFVSKNQMKFTQFAEKVKPQE
jgi:hypothetical protein